MAEKPARKPVIAAIVLPPITWRSWPVRDNWIKTSATVLALLAVWILASLLSGRPALGLMAAGVIVIAAWRFFLPVVFEADQKGISQTVLGRRIHVAWTNVAAHQIRAAGVLLLPNRNTDKLAPLHGLYVPWGDHRRKLVKLVEKNLGT